jgi:hypothetical protein
MSHRTSGSWVGGVVAAIVAIPLTLAAAGPQPVTLTRLASGLWSTPVVIDPAHPPLAMVVDTGSERTVLSAAAAARAGLSVTPGVRLATVAGVSDGGEADVPMLGVGGTTVAGPKVVVATLGTVVRDGGSDGILGMDVLGTGDVVLDFAGGELTLSQPTPRTRRSGVALPLRMVGTRVAVEARVDGQPRTLVLDSGADTLVLFEVARHGELVAFRTAGLGGLGWLARGEVSVGPLRLGGVPVLRTTAPSRRQGSDGVLPATAFTWIYIERSAGLVHVVPRRR